MTQTALTFEPAPIAARRCNDPQTIESRFAAFDSEHPEVWRAFERFALEAVMRGRSCIGAKAVWERLRWELDLGADDDDAPKLNNDFTALYARKWAQQYPEHKGLFRYRRRAGE